MKKYIFILFITLLVSSDSLWAYSESFMPNQSERELLNNDFLNSVLYGSRRSVRKWLKKGVDVNRQDRDGNTGLVLASYNGRTDIVKILLAAGANVDQQNDYGRTALYYADQENYIEIQNLLREAGAKEY